MSAMIVPQISKSVRLDNLIEDALEVISVLRPNWVEERDKNGVKIKVKIFSNGITNKLLGFRLATAAPKEMVIVKVYGEKTDLLIDRETEIVNFTVLHIKKCGAQLYALFDNGICYEFIPGECLTMETCRSPDVYALVATEMATIHKSIPLMSEPGTGKVRPEIWRKLRTFLAINVEILKENQPLKDKLLRDFGYGVETLKKDVDELEGILEKEGMPVVFCHNDTVLNNVIYNKEENFVRFIDFEYACPNYGPYDVANHFMEFAGLHNPDYSLCPKKEFRGNWISHYLKTFGMEGFSQEQFERWVELCFPLSDLYWALWCIVQEQFSSIQFDFLGYAGLRYLKYKKHMEEIKANTYSPE